MNQFQELMDRLTALYPDLSPQLRRAAKYVLDNPTDVAINSMRQVAGKAAVAPTTMTRLAHTLQMDGYEAFRVPFQNALRRQAGGFNDRARSLQAMAELDGDGGLFSRLATANLANVEDAYSGTGPVALERLANQLTQARRVYVLGMRACFALAHYFYHVGRMALPNLVLLRGDAGSLADEVIEIEAADMMIVIGFEPYTRDAVTTVRLARRRGAALVAITDSRASPLAAGAEHVFVTPTGSPQFFPSMVAPTALLECLLAFVVAAGGGSIIDHIALVDRLRRDYGVNWEENGGSTGG